MTRGLATLSINLEARLAELQAGFDRAARLAEKNAALIEARWNKLASVATSVGAALAGAFTVSQLATFFRTTVDGIDALNDLADATGASIENLSALEDVALRTGTSMDTVGAALVRFNAQLSAAKQGSETAELLKRIGLNAEELRRLDPAEALRRTAVALAGFADKGNQARLVQELFGKSVREVAPLLKDLAEQGALNASVTARQAAEAERFNKQLSALDKNFTDVSRSLVSELLPALNETFVRLRVGREVFGGFGETLRASLGGKSFSDAADGVQFYTRQLERLRATREIVERRGGQDSFRGNLADIDRQIEQAQKLEQFYRRVFSATAADNGQTDPQELARRGRAVSVPSVGGLPAPSNGKPSARKEFAGTVLDPLTAAALQRLEETDTARLGQLRLELQALLEIGGDVEAGNQGEALRTLREQIAKLDPEQIKAAANQQRLNELLGATPSGRLKEVLTDIELLNAAFGTGRITVEQWADAVRSSTAKLPRETEQAIEQISESNKQFQRNVQDVLGDNIASVLRGDFDSIEDAWKTMLLNMVAQATAADLAKRLFGAGGQGGGWLSALASFVGFADGGAFRNGAQITAFADGGVLTRPTFFGMQGGRLGVAGEAGYEGILPLRRGPSGRLGVEAYGSGGITIINNVAAGMTRGEVTAAIQLGMQSAEANVMQRLRGLRVV